MQTTIVEHIAMWSAWRPDLNLFHNSYFIQSPSGNVVVGRLPLADGDFNEIARRGGVAWIAITNRDNQHNARTYVESFGAKVAAGEADAAQVTIKVDRVLRDGDEFCGAHHRTSRPQDAGRSRVTLS